MLVARTSEQDAKGGALIATIRGLLDIGKYISIVSFLGLPNTTIVVAPTHPSFPCCANSVNVELEKLVHLVGCAHPLAAQHNLSHSSELVSAWSHHLLGPIKTG